MKYLNKEILDLWEEYSVEKTNGLMPLLYSELKSNAILFIGLNPSFSERGFNSILNGSRYKDLDVKKFYAHRNKGDFDQEISIDLDRIAKKKYAYFDKFRTISSFVDLDWEHIDLFFVRETNQKNMRKKIFVKGEEPNEFGRAQLALSERLIVKSEPKLIVVANALASRLFEKQFSTKFNDEKGCHYADINGKGIPVFLSGMLTGQRALDNFSFKRLKWHIKKTIN